MRPDYKLLIGKNSINQLLLNQLLRHLFTLIFTIGCFYLAHAQETTPQNQRSRGTSQNTNKDSTSLHLGDPVMTIEADTLVSDTLIGDSLVVDTVIAPKKDKEPFLQSKVEYKAKDSIRFDVIGKKVFLYNEAQIDYEDITLNANYIVIDWNTNTLHAEGTRDSTGKLVGKPKFTENGQFFDSEAMDYNFQTKKGRIVRVITTEGEGHIHGEVVKKMNEDYFYIKSGGYTTCTEEHPHFLIKSNKLKVIPNDKVVTGPAYLTFEDVPTPLVLPFGFFPNKKGQSSGIILPEYGESPTLGFFLKNGGYYFAINDHIDLAIRGDIYSKGSFGLRANSIYKKRYRYNGSIELDHNTVKQGEKEFPDYSLQRNYFVRWRHTQDPKARPNSNFAANVNAGSSNNFRNNLNSSTQDFLTNTFQSNISYSQSFPGTPFSYAVNASHSQNTLNKTMDITLPEFTFNMSRYYVSKLFKKKVVGKQTALDKIGISATFNARNTLTTADTALFKPEVYQNLDKVLKNGAQITVPLSTSFKLFNHFTFSPSINYQGRIYTKTVRKQWDNDLQELMVDTIQEIKMTHEANFRASLSTNVYGLVQFKKGKLQAVRHVFTPSLSLLLRPDYSTEQYGYFGANGTKASYSIYDLGIYGKPSTGEQGTLSLNLTNNLEMKVRTPKDTINTSKKVKILDYFGASASYNFFADSLNLSDISLGARTTLLNRLNVNLSGNLTPYVLDTNNNKINKFRWNEDKKLGKITTASLALSFNLNSQGQKTNTQQTPKTSDKGTAEQLEEINAHPEAYIDFTVPWNFFLSYNLTYSGLVEEDKFTQALNFNGDISLTPKWKVGVTSGYDFVANDLTQTSLNIYRDLHCWEAKFRWVPFGQLQSYSIDINVKAAVLQDLKLTRKRDWYDY